MSTHHAWQQLQQALALGAVCVVRVHHVQGSAPREVGAWMAVPAATDAGHWHALVGSIGGGHLEWQALQRAQQVLQGLQPEGVVRYALGPQLGQCCGGVVQLQYRLLRTPACLSEGEPLAALAPPAPMPVAVFGAGHAGQALVRVLQVLPCAVTWVDSRPQAWEAPPHAGTDAAWPGITRVHAEPVEDAVADLPAGSRVVVLTHSHAEDWSIVAACLARQRTHGDLPWVGLIGSATKWAGFRRRLLARSFAPAAVDAVRCPVGVEGVVGKEPEVIAVAIAAQLLQSRGL